MIPYVYGKLYLVVVIPPAKVCCVARKMTYLGLNSSLQLCNSGGFGGYLTLSKSVSEIAVHKLVGTWGVFSCVGGGGGGGGGDSLRRRDILVSERVTRVVYKCRTMPWFMVCRAKDGNLLSIARMKS